MAILSIWYGPWTILFSINIAHLDLFVVRWFPRIHNMAREIIQIDVTEGKGNNLSLNQFHYIQNNSYMFIIHFWIELNVIWQIFVNICYSCPTPTTLHTHIVFSHKVFIPPRHHHHHHHHTPHTVFSFCYFQYYPSK